MSTPEQFVSAYKNSLEQIFNISSKALESVEKLVDLNINAVKATLAEGADKAKEALELRDPQEFLQFSVALGQPNTDKVLAYSRHFGEITSAARAELVKLAESQLAENNKKFASLVDSISKNAPTGSESGIAVLKSAVAAANSAYDSLAKATKQLVELTEANVNAATNATVRAANQTAASVSKIKKAA